jgi:hypothetical protein
MSLLTYFWVIEIVCFLDQFFFKHISMVSVRYKVLA